MQPVTTTYHTVENQGYLFRITYDVNADKVKSCTAGNPGYEGQHAKAGRGDHTTAVLVFRDMVENAVRGYTAAECETNLRDLLKALKGLPTMQAPKASNVARQWLWSADTNLSKYEIGSVPTIMDQFVLARNMMHWSNVVNTHSSGGWGEATRAGRLDESNKRKRIAAKDKKISAIVPLDDEDMYAVWRLLDLRQRPHADDDELAAIILTHLFTIRLSYPFFIAAQHYEQLLKYATKKFWVEIRNWGDKGTIFAGWKAIENKIISKVLMAIKNNTFTQYAENMHPAYQGDFACARSEFYQ